MSNPSAFSLFDPNFLHLIMGSVKMMLQTRILKDVDEMALTKTLLKRRQEFSRHLILTILKVTLPNDV
jgi:hypothetical protein